MLTTTFAGRYLLWRAPTAGDHLRFPFEAVGTADARPAPLPYDPRPVATGRLATPAQGLWKGGTLQELLEATATTAFMALRDGVVALQWFAPGCDAQTVGRSLSVTKSVGWALVGQAIAAGRLPGVGAPIGELVGGLVDRGVAGLTLGQLMRMSSGIGYREGLSPWSDDARVYHGTRLREAALRLRLADPVDAFFHYNDWHPLLVAMALEKASGARVAELLARDLWAPLGAGSATMTLDSARPDSLAHLESGLNATATGLACFGQLILQRGVWNGRRVLPEQWLARLDDLSNAWRESESFAYYRRLPWGRPLSTGRVAYKDFWWHHTPRRGVHDVFAMGALGAHVYVSPDTRCVLVRQSGRFPKGLWWAPVLRGLAEQLAAG